MFKVGDEVEMTSHNPRHGLGSISVGDIGRVVEIFNNNGELVIVVNFPKQQKWSAAIRDIRLIESNNQGNIHRLQQSDPFESEKPKKKSFFDSLQMPF